MADTLQPSGLRATQPSGLWATWRDSVVVAATTWAAGLLAYVLLTAVSFLPYQDLPAKAGVPPTSISQAFDLWHRWDTTWYLLIADLGYRADERGTAFFPLYPMLVRLINPIVPGNTIVAALLLSSLACLVALILIHRLTTQALGPDDARRTVFYLLAFPTGFFLMAAYNESLFIALALGSLYLMRQRLWWWAGLLAGFAGATRLTGVLLGLAFAYEYLRQCGFSWRRIRPDVLGIALVPAGLVAYMIYCNQVFGNPTAFLKAQENWGRADFTWPWVTAGRIFDMLGSSPSLFGPDDIRNMVNLGTAVATLVLLTLAVVGPWKLGPEQVYLVIFAAAIMLLPVTRPLATYYPLASVWRYALECTAVFMVLARMGRNPAVDRIYPFVAIAIQGVLVVSFIQNEFVA
jgi:Gpi18-like mannosyltransferase